MPQSVNNTQVKNHSNSENDLDYYSVKLLVVFAYSVKTVDAQYHF